ncbi:hypothetical protein [Devosia sp. 1566]|uniref:hypothetical protein n=1 Tax=Devosia sp. 1566 TaxID=2499144 RepID=UPI000FDC4572|nr:hypothetical protein [Devosia sp. 1566]
MNVIILPSARERDARTNLTAFIDKARQSGAFGPVVFQEAVWEAVALRTKKRVTAGKVSEGLHFLTNGGGKGAGAPVPFPEPFGAFVKAVVRMRETWTPTAIENHRVLIRACRYLLPELEQFGYDPTYLIADHFDAAARRALEQLSPLTAYGTGKALAHVATIVSQYNLARVRIDWSNTIRRPHSQDRVSDEAVATRTKRLPTQAALDALPTIANLVAEDRDILRMRAIELLVCGGWRINELLNLPLDCEVEEATLKHGRPSENDDGSPGVRYGIRYKAEKGFSWTIKWIPTGMVDVARRAVADITRITQPVRDDALWMLDNPDSINIPELHRDPERLIKTKEFEAITGLKSQFFGDRSVPIFKTGGPRGEVAAKAGDIIKALLRESPIAQGEYPAHKYLFLIRENGMHAQRGALPGTVRHLTDAMISNFIVGSAGVRNVFERFGMFESDGSPIRVTSHQFRHWLNTLAQEGGMSQELIARWSGRKDMAQNAAYDHMTGRQLAEQVRAMADSGRVHGHLIQVGEGLPPADRKDFLATQLATAHVTDLGLCSHDWGLAPCPVHGDCASCGEHLIDKGNELQKQAAIDLLADVEGLIAVSVVEAEDGTYGANRWLDAHVRQRNDLKAVLAVHEDQSIPDGTLVHLGQQAAEPVERTSGR